MRLRIIFLLVALVALGSVAASFVDSIPLISQAKAMVLLATGDVDGAKTTQVNFINQAPLVSQIKSAINAAQGDLEEAKRTQQQFFKDFLEPLADSTPIIGHIRGGILIATGEKEKGERILKSATTSTFAVLGGVAGGPTGAIGAAVAADILISAIDSQTEKEFKPYGLVDYVSNIEKHLPGEHFDTVVGLGANFAGGKAVKKGGTKTKAPVKEGYGTGRGNGQRPLGEIFPDNIIQESASSSGWQRLSDVPPALRDYTNPRVLTLAREASGLLKVYAEKLEPTDFLAVNDLGGIRNCYLCSLAARRGQKVSQLMNELEIMGDVRGAPSVKYIVDLYRQAGFQHAQVIFEGSYRQFIGLFLKNRIRSERPVDFTIAYILGDEERHVVNGRVWKTGEGLNILTTDFQQAPFSGYRFQTDLPRNVKRIYVIGF